MKPPELLQASVFEMLHEMEPVFKTCEVDFYLVGAMARDIHLSKGTGRSLRATRDVDLAVLISSEADFYKLKDTFLATGAFEGHATEAFKLIYRSRIEVDLLPFGAIENVDRQTWIHKPRPFGMNVPGFLEASSFIEKQPIGEMELPVCPLEGIVLLKLIAHDDRPERSKDITDIEHILRAYFELCDDVIYASAMDVMDRYDTKHPNYLELISAHFIGRKMAFMLANSPALTERLEGILAKRPIETWLAMHAGFTGR